MTEQEQIEKLREEFQLKCAPLFKNNHAFGDRPFILHKNGEYFFANVEMAWQGFLMAKRNVQAVELPKIESPEGYYEYNEVFAALESAGIQYTIKGE